MELPKILKGLTRDGRAENQMTEKESEGSLMRRLYLGEVALKAKEFRVPSEVVDEMLHSYRFNAESGVRYITIKGKDLDLRRTSYNEWEVSVDGEKASDEATKEFNEKYGELIETIGSVLSSGNSHGEAVNEEREKWLELKKIGL